MKTCTKCGEDKELSQFSKKSAAPDGLQRECKICVKAYNAAYHIANKAKSNASSSAHYRANKESRYAKKVEWRRANPDKLQAQNNAWKAANLEKVRRSRDAWKIANPHKVNAMASKRRAAKLQATPSWAEDFLIEEAYDLAQRRTAVFGFEWHVDHVVPLQGKNVCGLHVHHNLQVIPGSENSSKSNRYWPDMPTTHSEQSLC